MADQKLVVDGDFSPYVAKAKQAKQATKDVADAAGKIGTSVANATLKLNVLLQGLRIAAQLISSANDRNIASSKTAGGRAVDFQTAAGSLGIKDSGGLLKKLEDTNGQGSIQSVVGLAQSFAQSQGGSDRKMDPGTIAQALQAARVNGEIGLGAGYSDLTQGLNRGRSLEDILAESRAKRGATSETAYNELGLRALEERGLISVDRQRLDAGRIARTQDSQAGANAANSGAMVQTAYEFVPDAIRNSVTPKGAAAKELAEASIELGKAVNASNTQNARPTYRPDPQ